ncbi:MAG: hypothetical protein AB4372_13560 [Xenococcus sp. (in: cyanobacteria)]
MDKIYRYKLIKLAIATPLAFSVALVLDIQASLSFMGPLFVFNIVWLFPDPIELKQFMILQLIPLLTATSLFAAFIAGITQINSIVVLFFILLAGWGLQTWMPTSVRLGLLSLGIYLATSVLRSSAPYTTTVYMMTLILAGIGFGWLVDRLFWPVYSSQMIEKQLSQLFYSLDNLSKDALSLDDDNSDFTSQNLQIEQLVKGISKVFKIAVMTHSLSLAEQQRLDQLILLQKKMILHLRELRDLTHINQDNPLLNQLKPELLTLKDTLSQNFLGLATLSYSTTSHSLLPNPNSSLQLWQNRLNKMREKRETQSFDLISRLRVGLVEYRLEGLVKTLCESINLLETHRLQVLSNQSIND